MESIIQKTLKLLLDKFGAEYQVVTVIEEEGHYRANIETDVPAKLIGHNGAILNALQAVLKTLLYAKSEEKIFMTIDVDGYRKDQEERIYEQVQHYIDLMEQQNLSEIKLKPMPPYKRRLVHLWILNNFPKLSTDSVGEDRDRAIRVFHK